MAVRFYNLSGYKAFAISYLIEQLNKTTDEKVKTLLYELIQRAEMLRTRDIHRFLVRILEIQQQTNINLSAIIPNSEEIQQIFQYPA